MFHAMMAYIDMHHPSLVFWESADPVEKEVKQAAPNTGTSMAQTKAKATWILLWQNSVHTITIALCVL